jgi:hypothetical protein
LDGDPMVKKVTKTNSISHTTENKIDAQTLLTMTI